MTVRIATNDDAQQWDRFCELLPQGHPFFWFDILRKTYRILPVFFIAEDAMGNISGVCPSYVVRQWNGTRQLISFKFGLSATTPQIANDILLAAHRYCVDQGIENNSITSGTTCIPTPYREVTKKTVMFPIEGSIDSVWQQLRNKTRNMIRKGQGSGVVIEEGNHHLPAFYSIYSERMLEKGVSIHSLRFFQEVLQRCGSSCVQLLVARRNNTVIAGMLLLYSKAVGAYPYQACRAGFEQYAPTQLLIWEAMQRCAARGITTLDMGESREGSSVYQSKINFGGRPENVYYYSTLSSEASPWASLPMILFQRLPFGLRRHLGVWLKRQGKLL